MRDAGVVEGRRQGVDRGAAADEDGDVAGLARTPGLGRWATVGGRIRLVDRPALGKSCAHGGGHIGRRLGAEVVGQTVICIVGAEQYHRGTGGTVDPSGDQRCVLGLCPWPVVDEAFEHGVDPVEDGSRRPEVLLEAYGVTAEGLAGVEIDGQVCPSEPVDRLLGITDEEQGPGPGSQAAPVLGDGVGVGDECRQLDLKRVGVLKLVEQ